MARSHEGGQVTKAGYREIIPVSKRRQYKQALEAYEAALREKTGAQSDEASPDSKSSRSSARS
jgi:hypothetical protein